MYNERGFLTQVNNKQGSQPLWSLIDVNSSAFHSWGNGGDANGYHILDFDSKTPNGENESYTFSTSSSVSIPVANFSFSTQSTQSPDYTVIFSDNSLYTPTSWSWNFGDGYISNQQNPSHSYYNSGTYNVTLTVSNQFGNDNITKSVYIPPNVIIEPLNIGCYSNSSTGYVNQPFETQCQIWSGTPPFTYELTFSVDNNIVLSQFFYNEFSFTKIFILTLSNIVTQNAKIQWMVTDANNLTAICSIFIDIIENETEQNIYADFDFYGNCDYVVDVNKPVTFTDMSYSTDPVNCPIQYWEWAFDWDTNTDDCTWWQLNFQPSHPCHWDLNYTTYQSTVSYSYPTIGIKTIRLLTSSDYDPNGTGHSIEGHCNQRNFKWGGVYVIDCNLTSTYHSFHPFYEGFIGALRNNSWNPNYIYGGTFYINGNANTYLNSNNIVISACKEIVVSGDVEFIASGNSELVLEINSNECLQNSANNAIYLISSKDVQNSVEFYKLKENKTDNELKNISTFPNPFYSDIEISTDNESIKSVKLIDINSIVLIDKKFDYQLNNLKLNTKDIIPGVYLLEINCEQTKFLKKVIKTGDL